MTAETQSLSNLEDLQEANRQAWIDLSAHLKQFNLSILPTKADPDGRAFWDSPAAVEAVRAFERTSQQLNRFRHPNAYAEASRRYRLAHLTECQERDRRYKENHPDVDRRAGSKYREAHGREHYWAHRDELIAYLAAWRKTHPQACAEHFNRWRQSHPDTVREVRLRRRARLANSEGEFMTAEFEELGREFNNRCVYCGGSESEVGPLLPDHVIPLSKGGTNFIQNILPVCRSCNSRKGNKDLEKFLATLASDGEAS